MLWAVEAIAKINTCPIPVHSHPPPPNHLQPYRLTASVIRFDTNCLAYTSVLLIHYLFASQPALRELED